MRSLATLFVVLFGLSSLSFSQPSCGTGLCLQQVSCTGGATTSISGVVYAPNGTDPLPNVTVYIPNGPVDPFTPGVSCPVVGQAPSGSPLVGTTTAVDGSFTLVNVPVGSNIPLVIVSGRWRRQLVIPGTVGCQANPLPANFAVMPQNQTQGDIPKIAIATGLGGPGGVRAAQGGHCGFGVHGSERDGADQYLLGKQLAGSADRFGDADAGFADGECYDAESV